MKKYRILWEKTQLGNTEILANNSEEARKIALDMEYKNQVSLNEDITNKTKQLWHFVDAYSITWNK